MKNLPLGIFLSSLVVVGTLSCDKDKMTKDVVGKTKAEILQLSLSELGSPTYIAVNNCWYELHGTADLQRFSEVNSAIVWEIRMSGGDLFRKSKSLFVYFGGDGKCAKAEIFKSAAI